MKVFYGSEESKMIDQYTIEDVGLSSLVLMERAAFATAKLVKKIAVKEFSSKEKVRILALCGSGNNGADGIATARIIMNDNLMRAGLSFLEEESKLSLEAAVLDYSKGHRRSPENQTQLEIAEKSQVEIFRAQDFDLNELTSYDIIIDALFGVGLSRPINGSYYDLFDQVEKSKAIKLALDLPSGLDASKGEVYGRALACDYTISLGVYKAGLFINPGRLYAGQVIRAGIGFCLNDNIKPLAYGFEDSDLPSYIKERKADENKGSAGKILIIAGSKLYCGAAALSAKAALSMGSGLVKVYSHKDNRAILLSQLPELLFDSYEDGLDGAYSFADNIVIGPGLSQDETALEVSEKLFALASNETLQGQELDDKGKGKKRSKRFIIDADCLNLIAANVDLNKAYFRAIDSGMQAVLTPHIGEAKRLIQAIKNPSDDLKSTFDKDLDEISIEDIKAHELDTCLLLAKAYKAIVVLKGSRELISDGDRVFVNEAGNPGMATAGCGDVLTGVLAATFNLMDKNLLECTALGCYIHSRCADDLAQKSGVYALKASDMAQEAGVWLYNCLRKGRE